MIIYPAIDIYEGKAVRLFQGDYARKTVYADDPAAVALRMKSEGATHIHLVDLEGAKLGRPVNDGIIKRIKEETGLFCEVGGGIRSLEAAASYIAAGIDRVILGTAAASGDGFAGEAASLYPGRIAAGIDIKDGFAAVKGWTESSGIDAFELCLRMQDAGIGTIICTDITKDGAMKGASAGLYKTLSEKLKVDIIASGGVSSLEDVRALSALGLHGAIIGKAYYTGDISLGEAIEAAK